MADDVTVLKSGVYRIDLGNGYYYVGSAYDMEKREREHHSGLRRGDHCNQIMQRVFNKYEEFSFTVLGRYPVDEILLREQDLLDEHHSDLKCANIAMVAGAPMTGRKASDQTREKMSTSRRRRTMAPCSAETRAKISAALTGKKRPPFTPEHRAAISAANAGKKRTPEQRATNSSAQTGKKLSTEHRAAMSRAGTERWARTRQATATA